MHYRVRKVASSIHMPYATPLLHTSLKGEPTSVLFRLCLDTSISPPRRCTPILPVSDYARYTKSFIREDNKGRGSRKTENLWLIGRIYGAYRERRKRAAHQSRPLSKSEQTTAGIPGCSCILTSAESVPAQEGRSALSP